MYTYVMCLSVRGKAKFENASSPCLTCRVFSCVCVCVCMPQIPWDESIYINAQEIHGGSVKGIAVHGTLKTDKQKAKLKKEKEAGG
jgi:hypothetical protein